MAGLIMQESTPIGSLGNHNLRNLHCVPKMSLLCLAITLTNMDRF